VTAQVDRVNDALEGLHEARARLSDLMLIETAPVVFELHVSLLSSVKRLLSELDLGERSRRQSRLRRPPRVLLPETIRRRPRR
jgi:hypothetical protein